MSWLNPMAPISPIAAATGIALRLVRAAIALATSMKPNAPAAESSTVSVGCSRKDSSVVPSSVVSIDSSDQAYSDSTPMPSAAARTELRARQTSHSVPSMHSEPSSENCSIGKVSTAPSAGR